MLGPSRADRPDGAVHARLGVEPAVEHSPLRCELLMSAPLTANVGLGVGRGLVNSPTVTNHSAQDRADSHKRSVVAGQTLAWGRVPSPEPG